MPNKNNISLFVFFICCFFPIFLNAQSENEVVAEINGKKITLKEIDESIARQLEPLNTQIKILRKTAINNYILRLVLETEAKKRGVSVEDLRKILTEVRVEVPQSEVEKEYLENIQAFGQMNADEAKERIRLAFESNLRIRKYLEQLEKLKSSAKITISSQFEDQINRTKIDTQGPTFGNVNAKVTIVEFSDFGCAFCRQSFTTMRQIMEKYQSQVKLVYKHLPITSQNGMTAARASVCADKQGKFWDYYDLLFSIDNFLSETLISHAKTLQLSINDFQNCLPSSETNQIVLKDIEEAKKLNITGTPTFYVNGRKIEGAIKFEDFAKIIEDEIALSKKMISK